MNWTSRVIAKFQSMNTAYKAHLSQNQILNPPLLTDDSLRIDLLWEISLIFLVQILHWQGMMHTLNSKSCQQGQLSLLFLRMINMYSGDKSCILFTLGFISKLAANHKISPIVTFDHISLSFGKLLEYLMTLKVIQWGISSCYLGDSIHWWIWAYWYIFEEERG